MKALLIAASFGLLAGSAFAGNGSSVGSVAAARTLLVSDLEYRRLSSRLDSSDTDKIVLPRTATEVIKEAGKIVTTETEKRVVLPVSLPQ